MCKVYTIWHKREVTCTNVKCLLLLTKFYIVHVHINFCLYFLWCEDHQFICRKKDSVRLISYEYVGFNLLYMVINTCWMYKKFNYCTQKVWCFTQFYDTKTLKKNSEELLHMYILRKSLKYIIYIFYCYCYIWYVLKVGMDGTGRKIYKL